MFKLSDPDKPNWDDGWSDYEWRELEWDSINKFDWLISMAES